MWVSPHRSLRLSLTVSHSSSLTHSAPGTVVINRNVSFWSRLCFLLASHRHVTKTSFAHLIQNKHFALTFKLINYNSISSLMTRKLTLISLWNIMKIYFPYGFYSYMITDLFRRFLHMNILLCYLLIILLVVEMWSAWIYTAQNCVHSNKQNQCDHVFPCSWRMWAWVSHTQTHRQYVTFCLCRCWFRVSCMQRRLQCWGDC